MKKLHLNRKHATCLFTCFWLQFVARYFDFFAADISAAEISIYDILAYVPEQVLIWPENVQTLVNFSIS